MTEKELLKLFNQTRKEKPSFNKKLIVFIIFLVLVFTSVVLWIFYHVGSEPSVIIVAFMGFCTGELWHMASIKKKKIEEEGRDGKDRLEDETFQ